MEFDDSQWVLGAWWGTIDAVNFLNRGGGELACMGLVRCGVGGLAGLGNLRPHVLASAGQEWAEWAEIAGLAIWRYGTLWRSVAEDNM